MTRIFHDRVIVPAVEMAIRNTILVFLSTGVRYTFKKQVSYHLKVSYHDQVLRNILNTFSDLLCWPSFFPQIVGIEPVAPLTVNVSVVQTEVAAGCSRVSELKLILENNI